MLMFKTAAVGISVALQHTTCSWAYSDLLPALPCAPVLHAAHVCCLAGQPSLQISSQTSGRMLSAHSTVPSTAAKVQGQHKKAAVLTRPGRRSMHASATAAAAPPASSKAAERTAKVVADEAQYVLQTYGRPADVVFVKGQGSKLYDMNGREYLDMAAGNHHCAPIVLCPQHTCLFPVVAHAPRRHAHWLLTTHHQQASVLEQQDAALGVHPAADAFQQICWHSF